MARTIDGVTVDDSERQPCEIWVRVMGYYRPVEFFNTGKKGEFRERVYFAEGSGKPAAQHDPELLKNLE